MKTVLLSLVACVALGSFANAQGTSRVELRPQQTSPVQAGAVAYSFELYDTQTKQVIGDADLAVSETKKLHMLVYDPGLKEFQHVHPQFDGKVWNVPMSFSVNGNYWVWAQGVLANGSAAFSSSARLLVQDGQLAWPAPPTLVDTRTGTADVTVVQLSGDQLIAGQMAMLDVTFSRNDGTQPSLSPYLGAFAHVVAVSNDGKTLQHVHPMSSGPNQGMIHAEFPTPGNYRLWIQFIDGGVLKVIPLALSVQ